MPAEPKNGIPSATPSDADTWPCFESNVNLLEGGCWWSTGGAAKGIAGQYAQIHGAAGGMQYQGWRNRMGGGSYTDGNWEPNVREYFVMFGN